MRKFLILLCLGLIGCATAIKETPMLKETAVLSEAEMNQIISVFSSTIKNNPNYAGAYYNRAIAYFYQNDYERCWQDVHKAKSLGLEFNSNFLASLKKSSGRQE